MTGQQIEVSTDDGEFSAYVARPEVDNGAIILVLQEIFGVNANMRKTADDFAMAGYTTIVPDLFWRQAPGLQLDPESSQDRDQAVKLMGGLDVDLALGDAAAAISSVRSGNESVGAVGYCLGGKLAYLLAATGQVDAAVSYYGVGIQADLDRAGTISCPTLLHIASEDHLCPPDAQKEIADVLSNYGERFTLVTHDRVGHAFARQMSSAYVPRAAKEADDTTYAFLASMLT